MSVISVTEKQSVIQLLETFDLSHLTGKTYEDTFKTLSNEFLLSSGASKLAIIPRSKDYVIKIPFIGCDYDYNEKEMFSSFYCPISQSADYCKADIIIYNEAKEAGMEVFFAEIEQIGEVQGVPIYIQQKAQIFEDCVPYEDQLDALDNENDEVMTSIKSEYPKLMEEEFLPPLWVKDFILNYGTSTFDELVDFLQQHAVDDLHSENVGYIANMPVLVDYSGFDG